MIKILISGVFTQGYILLLLAVAIVLKGIFFLKSKKETWKWSHFVHFDEKHIMASTSVDSQQAKRIQNYLTKMIIMIILLYIFASLLQTWIDMVQ